MTEEERRSWDEHRMLILSKLEELQEGQSQMTNKVDEVIRDYATLRVEVVKEAAQRAATQALWAALIPCVISICAMLINIFMKVYK